MRIPKTITEADTSQTRTTLGESTKKFAKIMSYSVRVWRGRCDDSA